MVRTQIMEHIITISDSRCIPSLPDETAMPPAQKLILIQTKGFHFWSPRRMVFLQRMPSRRWRTQNLTIGVAFEFNAKHVPSPLVHTNWHWATKRLSKVIWVRFRPEVLYFEYPVMLKRDEVIHHRENAGRLILRRLRTRSSIPVRS